MYFLAINRLRKDIDSASTGRIIAEHVTWAKERMAEGTLRQAGRWGEDGGASIIEADDIKEAEALLAKDPLVRERLVTFEMERFYPDTPL